MKKIRKIVVMAVALTLCAGTSAYIPQNVMAVENDINLAKSIIVDFDADMDVTSTYSIKEYSFDTGSTGSKIKCIIPEGNYTVDYKISKGSGVTVERESDTVFWIYPTMSKIIAPDDDYSSSSEIPSEEIHVDFITDSGDILSKYIIHKPNIYFEFDNIPSDLEYKKDLEFTVDLKYNTPFAIEPCNGSDLIIKDSEGNLILPDQMNGTYAPKGEINTMTLKITIKSDNYNDLTNKLYLYLCTSKNHNSVGKVLTLPINATVEPANPPTQTYPVKEYSFDTGSTGSKIKCIIPEGNYTVDYKISKGSGVTVERESDTVFWIYPTMSKIIAPDDDYSSSSEIPSEEIHVDFITDSGDILSKYIIHKPNIYFEFDNISSDLEYKKDLEFTVDLKYNTPFAIEPCNGSDLIIKDSESNLILPDQMNGTYAPKGEINTMTLKITIKSDNYNDLTNKLYLYLYTSKNHNSVGKVLTLPINVTTEPATTTKPVTTTNPVTTTQPIKVTLRGDANCDGKVTIADAAAIFQALGNPDKYSLSAQGEKNADVTGNNGVMPSDAVLIQAYDAKIIDEL